MGVCTSRCQTPASLPNESMAKAERNWEHVVPFFAYPESVRRIIYTSQLQLLRLLQRGYRSGRHRCSRKSEYA